MPLLQLLLVVDQLRPVPQCELRGVRLRIRARVGLLLVLLLLLLLLVLLALEMELEAQLLMLLLLLRHLLLLLLLLLLLETRTVPVPVSIRSSRAGAKHAIADPKPRPILLPSAASLYIRVRITAPALAPLFAPGASVRGGVGRDVHERDDVVLVVGDAERLERLAVDPEHGAEARVLGVQSRDLELARDGPVEGLLVLVLVRWLGAWFGRGCGRCGRVEVEVGWLG